MTPPNETFANDSKRTRWNIIILATMYAGYVALMLCRNTHVAASTTMINDPALDLDLTKYGQLLSWHSAGAIAGKLVSGLGADLIGGRRMFLLAVLLTGCSTAAFGMVSSLSSFKWLNFSGQFFKAGGWPAMAKIIGKWYSTHHHGRVWSAISTSSRVGTITALVGLGGLLAYVSWRQAFWLSAGVAFAVTAIGYFLLKEKPADVELAPPVDEAHDDYAASVEPVAHALDGTTLAEACLVIVGSLRVWLICLSIACLTVLVDFIGFIPLYLQKTLSITDAQASLSSSSFVTGMFVALIAAGILYDRFTKHQLVWVLGGMLAFGCACVLLLWSFPSLGIPDSAKSPITVTTLFAFGFAIATAYYIPMSIFAIAFGGPHSGFLIAVIDIFGYAAALVFNYFGGGIAQTYGWTVFLSVLLTVSILATVSMTTFLYLDARAEKSS